ncbi:efflux transporter outer membrane subunit [Piscinibacter gummiphilus]|uniref:Efflux transporter outer membrane subunit n=1 Tax=Piscinibacter gummiphilus TaxID=946333 RepID=A0ABZ0CST6_9BURK|nr:efflux transporter outer membrane subunit [Piscinibacter gummiphilus]WOB08019.1 efflux transporter outer membrane subunit [Piscinibacter gummiphilus]
MFDIRLTSLAAALMLAGCTSMAPKYERPVAPVAPAFTDSSTTTGTQAAADIAWQSFFVDERLKRLIEIALQNNRDLRVAVLNIEAARANYGVRRADLYPSLGVGLSGQRGPSQVVPGRLQTVFQAGIQLSAWEIDLFGRIQSLGNAAAAQYLASVEGRKAAQISLVAAVANTYLSLLADEELLAITRDTLGTREDSFKLNKLKFDNGAASELDLRQAESLLEAGKVTLAAVTRQRALDENALVLLIGQPLPTDLPPPLAIGEQRLAADLPAGLPSEVLTRRPDVRQAEQQLIAANANIGAARAAFFPRISLTGNAGSASSELDGLFKSGTKAWSISGNLVQPIFDAGRNSANLDLAKTNREIAVAQYEKSIQNAFREVQDALAGRATLGEQARAQLAQANAEQTRFRLADLRYRNGAASFLDVLDAQRALFSAQQAVVQVQAAMVQNQVNLYKVLGGGWTEPTATK